MTGLVMMSSPIGEADLRVVLLTKEMGKVAAFARGARRPGNGLMGRTSAFAFGRFELYQGRDSFTVRSADIHNYFRELALDYRLAGYGFYFLEFADYYAHENTDEAAMLGLVYQSLRALSKGTIPPLLIRRVFELRAMDIHGEFPAPEETGAQGDTLYTLRYIVASPIQKLYTFRTSEQVLNGLGEISDAYMKQNIDRKFKSLELLTDE